MEFTTCIKEVKTKAGLVFLKGVKYEMQLGQYGARIFYDNTKATSISIKSNSVFKKYFTFNN
ncbi:hypothetical protein OAD61_00070 [bacterium]|nr:hypothetical protein [bacterium]